MTSVQTLKSSAAGYFAWALNMCLCSGGSGLFIDLIPEDGDLRDFGTDEETVLGQSFERMSANRFRGCGTVSRVQCGDHTSPEVFYVAVAHAVRTVETAVQAQKQKEEREAPKIETEQKSDTTTAETLPSSSPALPPFSTVYTPDGTARPPQYTPVFPPAAQQAKKKETSLANIAPHILIVQDVDRAPARTIECLSEMLTVKTLSAPPGMTVGVLPDMLHVPLLFLVVAISSRVPRPSVTTNFSTNPSEGRLSDRFLNGFFMRIPIVLPKTPPSHSVAPTRLTRESLKQLVEAVSKVYVDPSIAKYVRECVSAVRSHPLIACGLPPKAADILTLAMKAQAALRTSRFVVPDDVTSCVLEVLAHRVIVVPTEVLPPEFTEENAVYLSRLIVAAAVSSIPVVK